MKGVSLAGAGRWNGFGTSDVEVVEAGLVVAVEEFDRSELVLARPEDVE